MMGKKFDELSVIVARCISETVIHKQIRVDGEDLIRICGLRDWSSVVFSESIVQWMPSFVDGILDAEYVPVSSYGERKPSTTFRAEIIESIAKNLKYEPRNYSSEENAFTRAVKSVVELKTGEIKKALTQEIDTKFRADAIAYAVKQLSERLGLDKKP